MEARASARALRLTAQRTTSHTRLSARRPHGSRAAGRVPGGEPASDVARIEAAFPELSRDVAADVKAIRAVDRDRLVGRQFLNPLFHPIRITPDRALHQV